MQLALETFWSILTLELVPQQGLESFVFCFPLFTFFTDYCFEKNGVGDGDRTRDTQSHSLVL